LIPVAWIELSFWSFFEFFVVLGILLEFRRTFILSTWPDLLFFVFVNSSKFSFFLGY
jgi:hypothetical protein